MPANELNNRILSEVHEMATGLYESGLMDDSEMKKFDILCKKQVNKMTRKKKRRLLLESREKAHAAPQT